MTATDPTAEITAESLLAQVPRDPGARFIPTRYPYTYAYDFTRSNPQVVPAGAFEAADRRRHPEDEPITADRILSRGETATVVTEWAALVGCEKDDLCRTLADSYLKLHGIERGNSREEQQ